MRLFIAIELSDDLRSHLVTMQNAVRAIAPDLSFTRAENLHLTLKFLGEVPDAQVPRVSDALAAIGPVGEFDLKSVGIVCFPERGRVRVVSAAVESTPNLIELQRQIERAMEAAGFPREGRAYHPHVTLARARNALPPPMRGRLMALDDASEPTELMRVHEFVLMESRLHPKGAQYTPASRFYIKLP